MKVSKLLDKVRKQKPIVHHLTNWVTIYDCANIVKALGASPVMAHGPEEVADMAKIASALVLNIGTLTTDFIEAMKLAAISANSKGIPVILDVCGAGATPFRDIKCFELLDQVRINIIKGNASEIAKIAGENVQTKGVDAGKVEKNLISVAQSLAKTRQAIVVITGQEDIIAGQNKTFLVRNGDEIMTHVVGTGCMAASVIGTFAAVHEDLAEAAAAGLACYEIAAEQAAKKANGPADFKVMMFDAIYKLNGKTADLKQRIVKK
ncbi:MAG: hydroxyethylthiazole kinase [bacterium]|nr:hydroxyethylthiazole kinase [bacterium]MDD5354156.1 hydroxyethylthiazole kinase [bacterium]MDD5755827.1 hydroxyethylthiazole kinase [bacterium]